MNYTPPFALYPTGRPVEEHTDVRDAMLRATHLLRQGVASVLLDAHGVEVADYRVSSPDCSANDVFGKPCRGDARWVPDTGRHLCDAHDMLGRSSDESGRVAAREAAFRTLGQDVA